jgi:ligand-binding sensor domain-containing protein
VTHYDNDADATDVLVRAILEDRQGRIWASQRAGVIVLKPVPGALPAAAHPAALPVEPAAKTPKPAGGPLALIAGDARRLGPTDGLTADRVRTLFEGRDGRIWIGTAAGLSEFDGERFRTYRAAQRISGNGLAEDTDGKSLDRH